MKKTFKLLSILLISLLVLVGCGSNAQTSVENGDEVVVDIKDNEITKDDIYTYLKLRFGPNLITTNLIDMQLEKYVTLDEEDKEAGQKRLEETKELLEDEFEEVIKASGYDSEEDYYQRVILNAIKNEKLFNTYLNENLADITEGLNTAKVKMIKTDSKPEAEAALAELLEKEDLSSEDFKEVAKTYSKVEEDTEVAESTIQHVYEERVELTFLNEELKTATPGLIDEVFMDGEVFYIVFVEELDLEEDKEMIINSIVGDELVNQVVSQSMFAHYSAKGDFEIHDADLYDLFKESNPFLVK